MTTAHAIQSQAKVVVLAAHMRRHGWQGSPVVVWEDDIQITGVHRAAAAELAGVEMETVELSEIFAEDGADWAEAVEIYSAEENPNVYVGILQMLSLLSDEIKSRYGIDLE